MKSKFFLFVTLIVIAVTCAVSYADNDYRFTVEEAARRNITLISEQQAKDIAAKKLAVSNVVFKEIDLDNEADDYPNSSSFRPVYSLECIAGAQEYDLDIDAVTGEVLKCKLDD